MKIIAFHSDKKESKVALLVRNISEVYPLATGIANSGVRIHMNNGHYYTTDEITFNELLKLIAASDR